MRLRHGGGQTVEFGIVEIDRLVVCRKEKERKTRDAGKKQTREPRTGILANGSTCLSQLFTHTVEHTVDEVH